MKKLVTSIGAAAYLTLTTQVFAQGPNIDPCTGAQGVLTTVCAVKDLGKVLGFIISIAFILAILVALFFLIYGGIKWITSGGDKAGVEAARNQIVAAVVGLIIVFLSFFILNLVLGFFGLSLINLALPQLSE